jgi:hypothetical protein
MSNVKLIQYQFWCTRWAFQLLRSSLFSDVQVEKVGNSKKKECENCERADKNQTECHEIEPNLSRCMREIILRFNDGGPNSFAHRLAHPPFIWRCGRFIWRYNAYLHGKILTLHDFIKAEAHAFEFFHFDLNYFLFFSFKIACYGHVVQ